MRDIAVMFPLGLIEDFLNQPSLLYIEGSHVTQQRIHQQQDIELYFCLVIE